MKDLPYYKLISVSQLSDLNAAKIKNEINNLKNPIIIDLLSFSPMNLDKIQALEQKLKLFLRSLHYPYPIFVLGICPDYSGPLQLIPDKKALPRFYPDRPKSIIKIHHELLHFNQIALREFECINYQKAQDKIGSYSISQKGINQSYLEYVALKEISKKVNLISELNEDRDDE